MKLCPCFSRFRFLMSCWLAFFLLALSTPVFSQAPATTASAPRPRPTYPLRNLAPHVFRPINPHLEDLSTSFVHDINPIKVQHGDDPNYAWATDVTFRPDIWYLSLELKPMRTIVVDLPGPDGRLRSQTVWYLIYKVRNPGMVYQQVQTSPSAQMVQVARTLAAVGKHPLPPDQRFYQIKPNAKVPIRFVPNFELVTLDATRLDPATGKLVPATMRYMDRFMPLAAQAIRTREDPGRDILNCAQMALRTIQPGEEIWGVALWCGVNPTTDKFSIYVSGLTNAMQWEEDLSKYSPGGRVGEGRQLKFKTLKLNYWKPGDETATGQRSEIFRMGAPGVDGGLDYLWLFR